MKLQIKDIINVITPIKDGEKSKFEALLETKLPIKASYRVMRLLDKLQPELKIYENKRNELVKEFGEEQENGEVRVVDPKKLEEFQKKIIELLDIEVDVDFEKLKLDELGDVIIAPKDLIPFIFE